VVADGYAVTMFSDQRQDFVVALDASTGDERWRVSLGPTFPGREGAVDGPVSTPAIAEGIVHALGPSGQLVAVSLEGGQILWQLDLVAELGAAVPHWGFGSSPLLTGDLVIVSAGGSDGRIVTAFRRQDGVQTWTAGTEGAEVNYPSPILAKIGGREQVLTASDTALLGLDPTTGGVLWRHAHGGTGFHGKIINPVVVDDSRLFLNLRSGESEMIQVSLNDGDFAVESLWTTRDIKGSYATPILHGRYIYGYSGARFSAVSATDGEVAWQSREPASGWPIVVDGHLVVLTKRGTLHVAKASPDEFREKAVVGMFDRLVWTPPSFAYGRIYGRDSFMRVACVDIVPRAEEDSRAARSTRGRILGSDFETWVAETRVATDRVERIERLLAERSTPGGGGFPIIENERLAHIVYFGKAKDIAITGDMLRVAEELSLHRLEGGAEGDLFYASFELEPDARVSYQLIRDLTERIADPRNPRPSKSLALFGDASQIVMPRAEEVPSPAAARQNSSLDEFTFDTKPLLVGAKEWGGSRKVRVYLPPGYSEDSRRYPTLYIHYGERLLETTDFDTLLDAQIGETIEPVIAVFIEATSPYEYARSQRGVHGRMVATELVPHIDAKYRTLAGPESRVIVGADEGGYSAVEIALRYPHVFGNVAAQSVLPIGDGERQLLDTIRLLPEQPIRVYLDWGRYDPRDPRNGTDVPASSQRLREALKNNGYEVIGREWSDGPDDRVLVDRLQNMLAAWFPRQDR